MVAKIPEQLVISQYQSLNRVFKKKIKNNLANLA